jgi:uncharacterized membrane protein YgcG
VSKATVSYHLRILKSPIRVDCARRYDWEEIQRLYDSGYTVRQCAKRFGFNLCSWSAAVKRGAITPRPRSAPIEKYLVVGHRGSRTNLKARLIGEGLKKNCCERCGLASWRGERLSMALHHINGDGLDYRLENLEILCPNCHAQTENFAGRGVRRRGSVSPTTRKDPLLTAIFLCYLRPRMSARTNIGAAIATVAVVAAGCGGGGDSSTETTAATTTNTTTLTKQDLIQQGDGICAEVNAAVGTIDSSSSDESTKASQEADLYSGMIDRLKGLGTPDDESGLDAVYNAGDDLVQAEQDAQLAAERNDSAALSTAQADAASALASFQDAASSYGFKECGQEAVAPQSGTSTAPGSPTAPETTTPVAPTTPAAPAAPAAPAPAPPAPSGSPGGASAGGTGGGSSGGGTGGGSSGGVGPG